MSEIALTYRGALEILGEYDRPRFDKIGTIVGVAFLAAPATAVLGPVAGFAATWAWIDQKNEALALIRRLVDGVAAKLAGIEGYERHQLIIAAHTTVAIAGFFDALREYLGEKEYASLELTQKEINRLSVESWRDKGDPLIEALYNSSVPLPSAGRGFVENCEQVEAWMTNLSKRVETFLRGLSAWSPRSRYMGHSLDEVVPLALGRYRSHYLRLAARVPEFFVWTSVAEHAATRVSIRNLREELENAFDERYTVAFSRLERILALTATHLDNDRENLRAIRRANQSSLGEPIVPTTAQPRDDGLTFPTIEQIYLTPRYRIDRFVNGRSRPWDETWWNGKATHKDLDVRLSAYAMSFESTRRPLLILGHPGAGKSMLTKVLAAKLPPAGYTVVRVPLRHVGSDSPLYQQIQEGLDLLTHGRVDWPALARESIDTIRVVLLDGLDELLQASRSQRTGYLQEIVEFQRSEAAQGRPVAVVVTSRTVVADRVRIPNDSMVIRLDEFDDKQVASWLRIWTGVNRAAIKSGHIHGLDAATALQQDELVRQPLLLLMLAIYSADPHSSSLAAGLSTAVLYRQLLRLFAEREVRKGLPIAGSEVTDEAINEQLWRIGVAALGMFNRGRQSTTDEELSADLSALLGQTSPADLGLRTIGQFFFIHTAEADLQRAVDTRRHYEFLHATFGEYLVASNVVDEAVRLASVPPDQRGRWEVDDSSLFAFLSHQPLATRSSVLDFAREILDELPDQTKGRLASLFELLLKGSRHRHGTTRFSEYRPLPVDHVREMAAYSANLVLLRLVLLPKDTPLSLDALVDAGDLAGWQSMVGLWRAGMDSDSWRALLRVLRFTDDSVCIPSETRSSADFADLLQFRLMGDRRADLRIAIGHAACGEAPLLVGGDREDEWLALAVGALVAPDPDKFTADFYGALLDLPAVDDPDRLKWFARLMHRLLARMSQQLGYEGVKAITSWLHSHRSDIEMNRYALTVAIMTFPRLLVEVPALRDPGNLWHGPGFEQLLGRVMERRDLSGQDRKALANLEVAVTARKLGRTQVAATVTQMGALVEAALPAGEDGSGEV